MFKVLGIEQAEELKESLLKIATKVSQGREVVMNTAAQNISNKAKKSIHKGSRGGKTYEWQVDLPGRKGDPVVEWKLFPNGKWLPVKPRNKPHTASAPGEPPKTDTGLLVNSIMWQSLAQGAEAGTDLMYGLYLEEGTKYMGERPWLQPVVDEETPEFYNAIVNMIKREIT